MLARIATAGSRRVDGHAPGLSGALLDAYLAAGVESDHECTELAEAEEKRRKGMWIFIRQGSASQNLRDLIPTVLAHGTDHVALCSDDREPDTLLEAGHLNDCVQLAVEAGVSEIDALVLATLNPAEYHGFTELGALGPGYQADILCFDTLSGFRPSRVYQRGRLVASDGAVVPGAVADTPPPDFMRRSVHLSSPPPAAAFGDAVVAGGPGAHHRRSTTGRSPRPPSSPTPRTRGQRRGPPGRGRTAPADGPDRTGLGAGLRPGAGRPGLDRRPRCAQLHGRRRPLALGPVAMAAAVARLAEIGGGQVAVDDQGAVLAELPLPIGGLMSDRPAREVADGLHRLVEAARSLGTTIHAPFMHMSFLGSRSFPNCA